MRVTWLRSARLRRLLAFVAGSLAAIAIVLYLYKSNANHSRLPGVPATWDDRSFADLTIPLSSPAHSPKPISSSTYYWIPIRTLYKTYPVYHPDHEPAGYIEKLKQQEPQEIWDETTLRTKHDWIEAGKLVFEAPIYGGALGPVSEEYARSLYVRDKSWHERVKAPVAADGTLPHYRYVVTKRGDVRVGVLACAMCHSRVLPDGTVVRGAQGNLPFDRAFAYDYRNGGGGFDQQVALERLLYHAPWITDDGVSRATTTDEIASRHEAIPAGVMARHGTSPDYPVVVPDLFDLKDRRYFDRTGVQRNRGIADVMRYAALNQGGDDLSAYGEFIPLGDMLGFVPPALFLGQGRYSDDQLYALALYLESLQPPANPHPFDDLAQLGKHLFDEQGCARCHTPPLFTSNKLTPVDGFNVPPDHHGKYAIEEESPGTDAGLALKTRRGTGYYKIPSLRNIWLRGPLGHDGSCASLEDWFDPRRLEPDYVPTGFVGQGTATRAVTGHEYGLDLDDDERRALTAYLRTL